VKLTIVTPCSRPDNLPRMLPGIEAGGLSFDLDWRIVFDLSVCQPVDVPGAKLDAVSVEGSRFGNAQRNLALDAIGDGWVYFLDDDNAIHPDFYRLLLAAMKAQPAKLAFAFDQELSIGHRHASPESMLVNCIDMAQVCIRRDLIGALRFQLHPYNADGRFIEALHTHAPRAWGFIPATMAYYNHLR